MIILILYLFYMKSKLGNSTSKVSVVNFRLPEKQSSEVAHKGRKTLDQIWNLIVAFVMDYPEESSDQQLWERFRPLLKQEFSYATFKNGLGVRKIGSLRMVQKGRKKEGKRVDEQGEALGSVKKSIEMTEAVTESFQKKRQKRAIMHLDRMDVIVGRATNILEEESKELAANIEKGKVFLESHLDKATKLHKLAGSVYNIDKESNEDLAKMQLAILTNFDPHAHLSSHLPERSVNGKVID